jgi:hypothetical protein
MAAKRAAPSHSAITVTVVPSVYNIHDRVMIEGGSLARECAWVPANAVTFEDGIPYLSFNRSCQALEDLCGTQLKGLKWIEDLKDARDVECKRLYSDALVAAGGSNRGSKRQLTPTLTLPKTASVGLVSENGAAFTIETLFTSDFRHMVAFQLTSESITNVVDCIRAHPDKNVRNVMPKRAERTYVSVFLEVRWSTALGALFVTWSDADGMVHRKQRRPWTVKPDDPEDEVRQLDYTAAWLHDFYQTNHRGPVDFIIPPALCNSDPLSEVSSDDDDVAVAIESAGSGGHNPSD